MHQISRLTILVLFGLEIASFGVAARAGTEDNVCSFYAKIGAAAADYMLPKTFGEVMAGVTGKNPEFMAGLTGALLKVVNGAEVVSVGSIPKADVKVLGKAAGQTVFRLLMTGKATSSEEAKSQMLQRCKTVGYQTIIANQRAADKLADQNMGGK